MTGSFRLFAVVTVLSVGACGASLFRKPVATVSADGTTSADGQDAFARGWNSPRVATGPRVVAGPTWVAESPRTNNDAAKPRKAPTVVLGEVRTSEPPELPVTSPIGNPIGPFSLASGSGGELAGDDAEPRRLPGAARLHRVEDGDTLTTLAERYLGDPNRAGEIADVNRGAIGPGGALPIGTDLEIPPRESQAPRPVSTAPNIVPGTFPAETPANTNAEPAMVPIEIGVIRPARER